MRERPTIEPRFFETYHYADVVSAAMEERFEHLVLWNEFFCDGRVACLVDPYQRESAFHAFLAHVIDSLLQDYMGDVDLDHHRVMARLSRGIPEVVEDLEVFCLPVERALKRHHLEFDSFVEWLRSHGKDFGTAGPDDVYEYFQELRFCGPYGDLIARSVREVFFILFANRELLLRFNVIVAECVRDFATQVVEEDLAEDVSQLFERPGMLRRAYMPEWVRRAVYFRDRGRCVACLTDLSGIVSLWSEENFDHMVPLAAGGLNDVTNIQLLCATCNRRKADVEVFTSSAYEDWYSIPDGAEARKG